MPSVSQVFSQGAIVNEVSNGNSGSQEYVELIAIGPDGNESCGPVDLRGFMIDDNNGDFSGGPGAGLGIARGHLRFSPAGPWGTIPAGAILLIYNSSDKNTSILLADDPYDANGDSVYIIPDTNSNLQRCTTLPSTSSDLYSPGSYVTGGAWATTNGLRNSGDAIQVRKSNSAFFHGLAYGSSPMNGGPDTIFLSGSGTGKVILFLNSINDNYRNGSNFSMVNASGNETPGAANNSANSDWIDLLKTSCSQPLGGEEVSAPKLSNIVEGIEIRVSPGEWLGTFFVENLSNAPRLVGKSVVDAYHPENRISMIDSFAETGMNAYRVGYTTQDGKIYYSEIEEIFLEPTGRFLVFPNPAQGKIKVQIPSMDFEGVLSVFSTEGREIFSQKCSEQFGHSLLQINLSAYPAGMYYVRLSGKQVYQQKVLLLQGW